MKEVFLDTSFAIALSVETDTHHQRAVQLARELERHRTKLVTTRAILLEIGNALSGYRYRDAAVRLLNALERDPQVACVPLTEQNYRRALALFCSRPDKEWGMIDCVSFVVMSQQDLSDALTADKHFEQAGFRAMLRE